MHKYFYKD